MKAPPNPEGDGDDPWQHWGAIASLNWPPGTVRHPAIFDVVERQLERPCAIDLGHAGLRLAYSVLGHSYDEAATDACAVLDHVLGRLGLTAQAVSEHQLFEFDEYHLPPGQVYTMNFPQPTIPPSSPDPDRLR